MARSDRITSTPAVEPVRAGVTSLHISSCLLPRASLRGSRLCGHYMGIVTCH